MSYRQSSYDPRAWNPQGPPFRPYDAKQKLGLAMMLVGALLALAFLVGEAGLMARWKGGTMPGSLLTLVGSLLLYSRRQTIAPEQQDAYRARQRRAAWWGLALAALAMLVGFLLTPSATHR